MDASAWDERYAGSDLVWGVEPNRFVVELTADLHPGTALDLACGEGRNASHLATHGWTVTAIDFSPVAVDRGQRLAAVPITWVVGDVLTAPLEPADLVLLSYVHLLPADRTALVARAAQAVAPGGALLVVAHDLRNLTDGVGGPQDPDLLWSPADITAEGLTGEATTRPRPVGDATAWDTVGLLRRT